MAYPISGQTVVVAAKGHVACTLANEAVILGLASGVYFGLNAVGTSVRRHIQEPKTVDEIHQALLEEYDVAPERCERDLVALLQNLESHGLIETATDALR